MADIEKQEDVTEKNEVSQIITVDESLEVEKNTKLKEIDLSKEKRDEVDDLIITEDNRFSVDVRYFKRDGEIFVEGVDEEFPDKSNELELGDEELKAKIPKKDVKTITVWFKYPNFSDARTITNMSNTDFSTTMTIADLIRLEQIRLVVLVRAWSLKTDIAQFDNLNVKIVKGLINQVRNKIGLDGIS